jgi:hypothetical protein
METIVRTFLLAAAFASALAAGAVAQTYDASISPRDPPFGKGNPGNDTMHLPSQADIGNWGTAYGSMTYDETSKGVRRVNRR